MREAELRLRQFVLLAIIDKTLWAGALHSTFLLAREGGKTHIKTLSSLFNVSSPPFRVTFVRHFEGFRP